MRERKPIYFAFCLKASADWRRRKRKARELRRSVKEIR